ncbi:PREDICTED: uncharacterized protein LOC105623046 [Atta cephalotes]|uniref:Gustatory receptor n=1 Tax=Atta cephalotes TaxID=12957 RepID=A0A158NQN3_ATTCE|nr:PREDICTED: uncharacterized protein LOC105623046 [Atta cephalotes]
MRHLHLELRKLSREVDSIFGTQMTFKMAFLYLFLFFHNVSKFLLINYVCETVSIKANATGYLLNKLSYSTFDVEVREVISQFSLQMTYKPLRFYGIGFFQFGSKFLYRFIMSIATVLVIVIQAHVNSN